jgi:hypothetical protein
VDLEGRGFSLAASWMKGTWMTVSPHR